MIRTIKPFALVKVVWLDSTERSGWHYSQQLERPMELQSIATIGFMIQNSPEAITLSASATEIGSCLSTLSIPWGCIQWAQVIKGGLKNVRRSNCAPPPEGAPGN